MTRHPWTKAIFTGFLLLCTALIATAARAEDRCAPRQTAELTGTATAQGYEMTQVLTLTRPAGAGLYGRWTGTRLEAWMRYDRPVDRVGKKKVKLPAELSFNLMDDWSLALPANTPATA